MAENSARKQWGRPLQKGASGNPLAEEANYDVTPDGQRFLVPERIGGTRKIHVVQNWFAAFRK